VLQVEQDRKGSPPTRNETDRLPQDELFDLLSNGRRRYVLQYLSQAGGTADFERLTDTVAAWENDTTVDRIEEDERKRVYVSLYQTHLPRLESSGVVTFDQEQGIVEAGVHAAEVARSLHDTEPETADPPWPLLYGTVGLGGLAMLTAAAADVGQFAGVPDVAVGVVAMAALLALVGAHYLYTEREESIGGMDIRARHEEQPTPTDRETE